MSIEALGEGRRITAFGAKTTDFLLET